MILRLIPFMAILCIGCSAGSKTAKMNAIAENNKDVVVLSHLIREYIRRTGSTDFTLADIMKADSLGRITKNFSRLEVANWPNLWRGGYAVYFKYTNGRNTDSVKLTQQEKMPLKVKEKKKIGRNEAQLSKKYDGEIHISYPERFYHIVGIIVKRPVQK
jgi:hypothetical protein